MRLSGLSEFESSDDTVVGSSIDVTIRTRSGDDDELIERVYTFGHAREWDKWVLEEYIERRTTDTDTIRRRDWTRAEHIMWTDPNEYRQIDVPPSVSEQLAEVTGADSITLQSPDGS